MNETETAVHAADVMKLADDRAYELRLKQLDLKRRATELPVELAKLGLRGTLIGAIVGFVLLVTLALVSAFYPKVEINGWHLCILTGIICTTVGTYGAFIFQRSFSVAAKLGDKAVEVGTGKDAVAHGGN
jgi:hypothetical protein